MAQYSELDAEQISQLLSEYSVGELSAFKISSGGSENTNYWISTSSGQFVLTVCEQKTFSEATNLANLLQHLAVQQFVTTKIIPRTNNEFVCSINDKPVLLKSFIEGSVIQDLPNKILISLGRQLAQLHNIPAPDYLPKQVTFGKESFSNIEQYAKGTLFHAWLYAIRERLSAHLDFGLPKALIHSDLFFNNVVVDSDGKTAAIMDFEEAACYYRVFDIGMTLVGLCSHDSQLDLVKSAAVMRGYLQVNELQKQEIGALQTFTAYAAAATGYWRHKQFNYVNPELEMANHYQEMTLLADQILDIPEADFHSLFI